MFHVSRPVRLLVVLAILLFAVSSAQAQDGWYGTATGAKAWFADDAFEGAISGDITQSFSGEFGIGVAVGYVFSRRPLRVEGEFWALFADVDELRNTLTTFKGGSDRHLASMVNLCYEAQTGGRIRPYVGAGIGVDVEKWGLHLITPTGGSTEGRYDTRPFFAYQFKAGLTHALGRRVDLLAGYRYFRTQKRELDSPSSQTPHPHDAQAIHLIEVGVRWNSY